jgi:tRNA-splicing ligase RtcB
MSKKGARSFADEKTFLEPDGRCKWTIKKGFVPNMKVPGTFYVNDALKELVFEELETYSTRGAQSGGFIPAVRTTLM